MAHKPIMARALKRGDRVAIVAPAYLPTVGDGSSLRRGLALLRSWGLSVEVLGRRSTERPSSGESDEARARNLNRAFAGDFDAVVCMRGGFGSARIVDDLDVSAFVQRRGTFVGFSDATTIHTRLNRERLVTFYRPPIAWAVRNGATGQASTTTAGESLRRALFDRPLLPVRARATDPPASPGQLSGEQAVGYSLRHGEKVRGHIVGGNLMTLASGVGTSSQLVGRAAIVFLEEVEEPLATLDRLLTQLILGGSLAGAVGVVIGQLTRCGDARRVEALLRARLIELGVPFLGGIPAGHGPDQETIALGATVELDPRARVLSYLA